MSPLPQLPGSLLLSKAGATWSFEDGELHSWTAVDYVVQTDGHLYAVNGSDLLEADAAGNWRKVRSYSDRISQLSAGSAQKLAATIESRRPWVAWVGSDTDIRVDRLEVREYGSLPISAAAISPVSGELAVGVGPDVYLMTQSDQPDMTREAGIWQICTGGERIAACGVMGVGRGASQDVSIISSLTWSPDGRSIAGHARRTSGSGASSSFLLTRKGDRWEQKAIEGERFAWSPDGRFLASEIFDPVEQESKIVVTESGQVRGSWSGYRLSGWISSRT